MARARLLKPGFFKNELLAELPFEGRLLFAGLWTLADREGRMEDRPKRIKAEVFPFDEVDVYGLLNALEQKGFIERYTRNAMPLIQIAKFSDHQTPHVRELQSTLPGPEHDLGDASPSPRSPVYGNGSSSVYGNGSVSAEPLTRSTPIVAFGIFPIVGKGGPRWELEESQVVKWEDLYPGLNVRAEMDKALAWTEANPGRRKTSKGMPAFLVNWLSRATDRRGGGDRRAMLTEPQQGGHVSPKGIVTPCPHTPECLATWACGNRQLAEREKRAS